MKRRHIAAAITVPVMITIAIGVASCSDGGKARGDLTEENIHLDTDPMDVIVSADGFPNIGHKCRRFGEGGAVVGMWTTTDRTLILVYNDHACAGANLEQDMVVINGVPRAVVNASG